MMLRSLVHWLLVSCFAAAPVPAARADALPGVGGLPFLAPPVQAEAFFARNTPAAGGPAVVAVKIDVAPGFHINPDAARSGPAWFPGQYPTTLTLNGPPPGVRAGAVQFPEPRPYRPAYADGNELDVYEGTVTLYVPLLIDADQPAGPLRLSLTLDVQACDATRCLIPQQIELTAEATVRPAGATPDADPDADADLRGEAFAGFDPAGWAMLAAGGGADGPSVPGADDDAAAAGPHGDGGADGDEGSATDATAWLTNLLTAAAAGLALNFMPCVLPVLPLKVMSLANHDGGRGRTLLLALVMAAGIVLFWMAIAVALAGLRQFGAVNQLFQYPLFTLGVGVLVAVLAVSMMGLFTLNLPRAVYQFSPTGNTVMGSLGFGVMTAVLATPCAGPLMGTAAFWATQQGPATTLAVFAALGAGMALPYLVLAAAPGLLRRLPRAGGGSELLKQTMGVLMLAAAAFFIGSGWVGLRSDGTGATGRGHWWAVGGLIAAAGGWLLWRGVVVGGWVRTTDPAKATVRTAGGRAAAAVAAAALMIAGAWVGVNLSRGDAAYAGGTGGGGGDAAGGGIAWTYYTPDRLAEARAAGRAVVLEFTADWCLNCKLLEQTVLGTDAVRAALNGPGVTAMKVDITSSRNVAGNALLQEMGRVTIPLLVVQDAGGREVFKADFYSAAQVVDAVGRAVAAEVAAGF